MIHKLTEMESYSQWHKFTLPFVCVLIVLWDF